MAELQPNSATTAAASTTAPRHGPVVRLCAAALACLPAVGAVAFALVGPNILAIGAALSGYLLAASLVVALLRQGYPHGTLGLCNWVTLGRLGFSMALLAPLVAAASGWAVLTVALVALALDGVDGWLARREGRVSAFGARFDMEVDAVLGLILALNAWASGTVGAVVLLLGIPRYVFVAAARVWPWLGRPLPDRFGRKVVCVLQVGALIALQAPVVAGPLAAWLVAAAAGALAWSFGRDVWWLWRARS